MIPWTKNCDLFVRPLRVTAVLALCLPLSCRFTLGQSLSQHELSVVNSALQESFQSFEEAIDQVTINQWTFKPSPSKWSMAEIAEHIVLADRLYLKIVESCLATPSEKQRGEKLKGKEQEMIDRLNDQSVKARAPEILIPKGTYKIPGAALAAMQEQMVLTADFLKAHPGSYNDHIAVHPQHGELTAYQWILMIPSHANHHIAQMAALKESPAYPED